MHIILPGRWRGISCAEYSGRLLGIIQEMSIDTKIPGKNTCAATLKSRRKFVNYVKVKQQNKSYLQGKRQSNCSVVKWVTCNFAVVFVIGFVKGNSFGVVPKLCCPDDIGRTYGTAAEITLGLALSPRRLR